MTSDSIPETGGAPSGLDVSLSHPILSVDEAAIRRLVAMIVRHEEVSIDYLGVVLCGRAEHQELHRRFLGDPGPTDVLAFDFESGPGRIDGEVYVDLDTANERYQEFDSTFREEVFRYVAHGVLHLIGYRDKNSGDAERMQERQEMLIRRFVESDSAGPE